MNSAKDYSIKSWIRIIPLILLFMLINSCDKVNKPVGPVFEEEAWRDVAEANGMNPDTLSSGFNTANAHQFILQEPEGYQRLIGDRGSKLSGGQKQRVTIARALLKNPSILILDEATSALDSESEMLVQDAINKLMKSRTSIVIAHRLSTIQNADEILVINEGKIVERGTHGELMKLDGIYQKLTAMQGL